MTAINESPSEDGVRSRRNVLALLGGAVAGAVAGALGRPERASGGHDGTNVLHLGEVNVTPAGASTAVGATADIFAFRVHNETNGPNAGGVLASSKGNQPGILGNGFAPSPAGVRGVSTSSTGLPDGSRTGVEGISGTGVGVEGGCPSGVGVFGHSDTGTGVRAASQSGQALRVEGRAVFSTAGSGTVPHGQNSVFVSNPAVTANTHVSVTLVGNPGIRALHWVQRSPGSGFTVRLTPAPTNQRPATAFTYLVVEAPA